jgi:hypothetical protein
LIFTLVSTDWPCGQYRLGQGAYMLFLPMATSPLEHPTAVGTAPDSPPGASARCARASGSPTGAPLFMCGRPPSLEKGAPGDKKSPRAFAPAPAGGQPSEFLRFVIGQPLVREGDGVRGCPYRCASTRPLASMTPVSAGDRFDCPGLGEEARRHSRG